MFTYISQGQERLFDAVTNNLRQHGYRNRLECPYSFKDYFHSDTPRREVPCVAFGESSYTYETACISVLLSNGKHGPALINECRGVGSPIAFELRDDGFTVWKVGERAPTEKEFVKANKIEEAFAKYEDIWSPKAILRAKNIPQSASPQQLELFDPGLIPALERQVREKLSAMLGDVLRTAIHKYGQRNPQAPTPDYAELFRLVFRVLAAKVLHDRRVNGFKSFSGTADPKDVLDKVAKYYRQEREKIPRDSQTQRLVFSKLWAGIDFTNLSVNVLADIYENTLVSKETRRESGTHSTPPSIARYIADNLISQKVRGLVLEPCSGHGIFLVAALRKLKALLPPGSPRKRHAYFVKTLRGYEPDVFAREVGKLCLMLADFPNPNGWRLEDADVLKSNKFLRDLSRAHIVLCNPPFEKGFPLELLKRVLDRLHPKGALGFVLPPQFPDGRQYYEIRRLLASRFREIEIVALPDKIFHVSTIESALLIAKSPAHHNEVTTISFVEVQDKDRMHFLERHAYTRRESDTKSVADAAVSFVVPYPLEVWKYLAGRPTVRTMAEVRRGIHWGACGEIRDYSDRPGLGRVEGYGRVQKDFSAFSAPKTTYMKLPHAVVSGEAFRFPWGDPKIVVNSHRTGRSPWRLAAFVDEEKRYCSQSFLCLWPKQDGYPLEVFAAIVNGPVANAFVTSRDLRQDNRVETVREIPLPELPLPDQQSIVDLVRHYMELGRKIFESEEKIKDLLLQIDALVLKGYNLPPRLERILLDRFQGHQRNVSCHFTEYYPESFVPTIPLGLYVSPEYKKHDAKYFIDNIPQITDPAILKALREVE
jgi:hypothetical protein